MSKLFPEIIVLAHNIRSTHNVGSIFRTSEGLGIDKIILSGYTPYPEIQNDKRLPHIKNKITQQIHKTALGAEKEIPFEYKDSLDLITLKNAGYKIIALEQSSKSIKLPDFKLNDQKIALLLGEEVKGIDTDILNQCDYILEIPMFGKKESFNVSVAAGMALYNLRFISKQPHLRQEA